MTHAGTRCCQLLGSALADIGRRHSISTPMAPKLELSPALAHCSEADKMWHGMTALASQNQAFEPVTRPIAATMSGVMTSDSCKPGRGPDCFGHSQSSQIEASLEWEFQRVQTRLLTLHWDAVMGNLCIRMVCKNDAGRAAWARDLNALLCRLSPSQLA